jgi:hypothetical protein
MDMPHHLRLHRLFLREKPTTRSAATHLKQETHGTLERSVEPNSKGRYRGLFHL